MSGAAEASASRPASESTPSALVGPDPGVLPAGTTLRFLVLVVAMVAATVEMVSGILRPFSMPGHGAVVRVRRGVRKPYPNRT